MDTSQWPQGIGVLNKAVESSKEVQERKPRPQKEQANCPRCNSTNTKFCYYNNYSLSQPRYFCKTCRRYWTEGGSLRNVPVGGGSRKNKRCPPSSKKLPDLTTPLVVNPKTTNDLNFTDFMALPFTHDNKSLHASFMPISDANNTLYSSSSLPNNLHDFKPSLNFSLNGFEDHGYVNLQGDDQESSTVGAKLFFPLEDFKNADHDDNEFEQNRGHAHQSNGFWNGMLGGGSSW